MPIFTIRNRHSAVELGDFGDALKLYRNQRLRGAAPVLVTSEPRFTPEQDAAIDAVNHETNRHHSEGNTI